MKRPHRRLPQPAVRFFLALRLQIWYYQSQFDERLEKAMKNRNKLIGYLFAVFTIIVWGSTFISSKVLLRHYTPLKSC